MKTQSSFRHYGFTMIELMFVVTTMLLLWYLTSGMSYRPQEHHIKAERLANKISSLLHETSLFLSSGRMDNTDPPQAITGAILTFSTGTGGKISWYYSQNLNGIFQNPYFDGDPNYYIESIEWTGALSAPISGTVSVVDVIFSKDGTVFSGAGINTGATLLTFKARYGTRAKNVLFDRRTGRVEINKE
jgi:hypothetical protein